MLFPSSASLVCSDTFHQDATQAYCEANNLSKTSTTLSPISFVPLSPPKSLVLRSSPPKAFESNTFLTAVSMSSASFGLPREYRSMRAADRMVPMGLAMSWLAMSGAD